MHKPLDPEYTTRVRLSFGEQRAMAMIGASLGTVAPGAVDVVLPFRDDLTQQDGFLHAGIVAAIADSSCGYAAYTLMPASARVLSIEFKLNLLAPAVGERLEARGRVIRSGSTITVCRADVAAITGESEKLVATMIGTMMCVGDRG
ncbi:MAG TPA: PaaI family thioesterase [Gemmatimonadaceae bacterium]|nr:PaaI family thioesterase [Gemmatimonadaceae bacterium]